MGEKSRFSIVAVDAEEGDEQVLLENLGSVKEGAGSVGVDCGGTSLQEVLDAVKAWRETAPSRSYKFFNFELPDIFQAMQMGASAATSMLREVAREAAPSYSSSSGKSFVGKLWEYARGVEAEPNTDMVIQITIGNISNTFAGTVADIPKQRGRKAEQ